MASLLSYIGIKGIKWKAGLHFPMSNSAPFQKHLFLVIKIFIFLSFLRKWSIDLSALATKIYKKRGFMKPLQWQ